MQDYVSKSLGAHTVVMGGQTRFLSFENAAPMNFNGQYVFSGGKAPVLGASNQPVLGSNGLPLTESISSLERYRRTLVLGQWG